jgi:hypothetical protein
MDSKHLSNNLHAVTKRGQLAAKFMGHPKQLRIPVRPIANHPSLPNSLPSKLFLKFQYLLLWILFAFGEQQSIAPTILYDLHLLPPSMLPPVRAKRQPPFPTLVRSAGKHDTFSVHLAFDELRLSWSEDNRVDSGTEMAEIEVCIRGRLFAWKRSGFKEELGLGRHERE